MAQLPLATSFDGDFIVKLVVVDDDDTMDEVARKTAGHSAGRTVRARTGGVLRVRLTGASIPFEREVTPRQMGLGPMESIEVYYEEDGRMSNDHVAPGNPR
jgi:toluene monooxygenase system protein B